MRYLITVSYDGSKFFGFQKLNNNVTVQGELENALSKINKSHVYVKGSGRTDRGVHSLGQRCHFDLDVNVPPKRLINAINSIIMLNMYVADCEIVSDDFHARFNVKRKVYKYIINLGKFDVFKNDYVYNYCNNLDIDSMIDASKYLLGKHSFKAFVSGNRDNYNSEIYDIKFLKENNYLYITFVGKSFYRYMVRNLVGALMLVGKGKITGVMLKDMLDSQYNKYNYMTVPASGLYLERVDY